MKNRPRSSITKIGEKFARGRAGWRREARITRSGSGYARAFVGRTERTLTRERGVISVSVSSI